MSTYPSPFDGTQSFSRSPGASSTSFVAQFGRSPPTATVLGSSPPAGSSDKDAGGAKRFWKRLQHDSTLVPSEFSIGFVESLRNQERKSGTGAWSHRVHDVMRELPYHEFINAHGAGDIPFHRITFFKCRGAAVWESEYYQKHPFGRSGAASSFADGFTLSVSAGGAASCPGGGGSGRPPLGSSGSFRRPSLQRGDAAAAVSDLELFDDIDDVEDDGQDMFQLDSESDDEGGSEGNCSTHLGQYEEPYERHLPEICWLSIIGNVGVREVCMLAKVNKFLRDVAGHASVWQQQHHQLFGEAPHADSSCAVVRRLCRRSELRAARWLEASVSSRHAGVGLCGTTCLKIDESKVVSGDGSAVRLWSHDSGRRIAKLQGHSGRVSCVAFDDDFILSGCTQSAVRVWGMDDLKCRRTLRGHDDALTDVAIMNGIPISACEGGHIKLWDMSSGQPIVALDSPHAVYAMQVQQQTGYLISAGWCVHMWDVSTAQILHSLTINGHDDGHSGDDDLAAELSALGLGVGTNVHRPQAADPWAASPFTCVSYSGNLLAAGRAGEVVLWDPRTQGVIASVLHGGAVDKEGPCSCAGVQLDEDWKLVAAFGDASNSVCVYDIRAVSSAARGRQAVARLAPVQMITAPARVNCFQFHNQTLVAGIEGQDCMVWNCDKPSTLCGHTPIPHRPHHPGSAFHLNHSDGGLPPLPPGGSPPSTFYGASPPGGGGIKKEKKKPAKAAKGQNRYPKRK